jgi:hypothetical protein
MKAGQIQPTGGAHTSLRTHLRAALVYTYIEELGVVELTRKSLFTDNRLGQNMVE